MVRAGSLSLILHFLVLMPVVFLSGAKQKSSSLKVQVHFVEENFSKKRKKASKTASKKAFHSKKASPRLGAFSRRQNSEQKDLFQGLPYPVEALRKQQEGTVQVALKCRSSGCRLKLLKSSGYAELDQGTLKELRKLLPYLSDLKEQKLSYHFKIR